MLLPTRTIQATAEHLTAVLTAVTADTVGTVRPMFPRPRAITEAGKLARLVPISPPALRIQAPAQPITALTVLQADIV